MDVPRYGDFVLPTLDGDANSRNVTFRDRLYAATPFRWLGLLNAPWLSDGRKHPIARAVHAVRQASFPSSPRLMPPRYPVAPTPRTSTAVLRVSLTAFDRAPKPANGRLKGSSPFNNSLGPMSRPTPGPLGQRQALRQRQELARGKAGRYRGGNCPGCGSAPIEACREADGLGLTAVRLGRFFGLLSIAVVEAGRA